MSIQQYNVYDGLTAVRVVSTSNIAGTYFNGQTNSGVGATLTVTATGVLSIDSVTMNPGDPVLLVGQTSANQNGIYIVSNPGATGINPVLTRRNDFQNIEQIRAGQFVSVAAGTVNNGTVWTIVEPLPAQFGISNMTWVDASGTSGTFGTAAFKNASDNTQPTVSSVNGATVANNLAVFADTAGSVKAASTAATLGFGLTLTTGNFAATAGSGTFGSSGNAGTVTSFPGTAANGSLILAAVNAGGNFNTTISNGTMGQSTVYTMGDIGAATGGLVVATAAIRMKSVAQAAVAGGAAAQTVTDAFCTSGSMVTASWNDTTNAVQIQKVAAGNGSFVVTSTADPGASHLNYIITK